MMQQDILFDLLCVYAYGMEMVGNPTDENSSIFILILVH